MIKLELPFDIGDEIYLIRKPEPTHRLQAKVYEIKINKPNGVIISWVQYDYNYEEPDEVWDEGEVYLEDLNKTWTINWDECVKQYKKRFNINLDLPEDIF